MNIKVKIKSDWYESTYDSWFDREGIEFRRFSDEGMDRPRMFELFDFYDIPHPFFGKFEDFRKNFYNLERKVVIYDNIRDHKGEKKRLISLSDIKEYEKEKYLCEFIKTDQHIFQPHQSKSTRHIFIGKQTFAYDYYSLEDWRSNCGDGMITEPILIDTPKWRKEIHRPLFAIDYVGPSYDLKAIDWNESPGIHGVKFKKYLSGQDIVQAIKSWMVEWEII